MKMSDVSRDKSDRSIKIDPLGEYLTRKGAKKYLYAVKTEYDNYPSRNLFHI